MKFLLNKKLAVLITVGVLGSSIANAQMPDHLSQLKKRGFIFLPGNKSLSPRKIEDRTHNINVNVPCLKKQNTLGGTGDDYGGRRIPTNDGGFIVAGGTNSGDGDFKVPATNGFDAFIAKYNRFRQLQWTKTFGGSGDENFNDIFQTFDGGYIATGNSTSNDGNVSGNHGGIDVLVVKFSASGNVEWQKCLGGNGDDLGDAGIQTFYGGYSIGAHTNSNDGNVSGNHGDFDAWIVQLGPKGNILSQHCYGGTGYDQLNVIVSSDWGSLIFAGWTVSNDGDVSGNHGASDVWVVKTALSGKIIWQKTVGGSGDESPSNNIAKTTDGNVVIDGWSLSVDGDINAKANIVSFVTKLNPHTGNIIWSKSYAASGLIAGFGRGGFGIFATKDGGAVEIGNVGPTFDSQTWDALVSKLDAHGNEEWYKTLGGSNFDNAVNGGYEGPNGTLNILCQTASTDGDVKNNHGGIDTWLIKLGRCGEEDKDELPVTVSGNKTISISKDKIVSLSNYPNPFSNSTNISFSIPQSQKVSMQIFDGAGRLIKTIADAQMQAGSHQYTWNAKDEKGNAVASGIYYLKFNAGNYVETKKISVIK